MAAGKKAGARDIALDVLTRIEEKRSYSNLELKHVLDKTPLSAPDAGLVTELVYGTIQRRHTLEYVLAQFVKGQKKLQPWVRQLLLLSLYQIRYLDRVPDRAAVHEAVEIAKRRGHAGIASLVNGVLRNVLRQPQVWEKLPDKTPVERIAFQESHPEWLVARWLRVYGEAETNAICRSNNLPPHPSVRVNRLKTTREELLAAMRAEAPEASLSSVSPFGILPGPGNPAHSRWYREGYCTIQDESSMLVAPALGVKAGHRVLDACAAPGGKTTHLAELMENQGEIIACDIHPHKEELIRQNAERLGITIIKTLVSDAWHLPDRGLGQFDRILLDAPCTGFGVIRRKPDLKWNKSADDIAEIAALQMQLLTRLSGMLAPGGLLVYSTCTIEPEENQLLVERFVAEHPEFALDDALVEDLPPAVAAKAETGRGYVQILPHHFHSDGFFIARLKRRA
ncbi:16S rRNA (cytosine(967)-C(5))-methyltransferase RsmB [Brevibacillus sp. SYP-B805]|uniref:16S rRNA (cytosine(967)-C(5))-methyltransferase RsmB n=1 Tax=Brevibacillus sp. SYP-B805 TaxID=1578199 RepID=UPI0013EB732F|nr:16S rRNA (cytosine(967)-C(5))-methyltransferase RsmB [Brevibacillus sp. SYP-B805]